MFRQAGPPWVPPAPTRGCLAAGSGLTALSVDSTRSPTPSSSTSSTTSFSTGRKTTRSGGSPASRPAPAQTHRSTAATLWPVLQVDWHAARAYCAWRATIDGLPWRLPYELEREKATVGADGRRLPWGDQLEGTWSRCRTGQPGRPLPAPVGTYPVDESVYGIRDLAGNCRDWCLDPRTSEGPRITPSGRWEPAEIDPAASVWRVSRGGSWAAGHGYCVAGARFGVPASYRTALLGFRLFRSLPSAR